MITNDKIMEDIAPYIYGTATRCSYCEKLNTLILIMGMHSYITLAIGQIVEGYLQVCAKEHRTASTGLLDYEVDEFVKMKKIVRKVYEEVYHTKGIAFEHGEAGNCLVQDNIENSKHSLCHHAHIHYMPVQVDIRNQIKNILDHEYIINNYGELKKYREEHLMGAPYVYFEDLNEIGYMYPVLNVEIPRQFLRKCVANELGLYERYDWLKYPGFEHFNAGRTKMINTMRKIGRQILGK